MPLMAMFSSPPLIDTCHIIDEISFAIFDADWRFYYFLITLPLMLLPFRVFAIIVSFMLSFIDAFAGYFDDAAISPLFSPLSSSAFRHTFVDFLSCCR